MRKLVVWLVILGLLGGGAAYGYQWYRARGKTDAASYRTVAVKHADIVSSISATGTIVPEDVVDVGAQVNGLIASFGLDKDGKPVDYRSEIDEGAVLAKIDDALYLADVSTAEAQLAQARAQVKVAEANKSQAQAKLDQAERDWARAQKLGQSKAISQADYDAAKSSYEQGTANIALSDASIGQANAQVSMAEASVMRARRNLAYCTIRAPVSGTVIDRRVEIGQTVVASMNAPSLFLLAKDLTKMKVLVQVNEADVGHVIVGRPVTFSADAFPGETFKGVVRKVRLNATMTQNVVTYTAEISTDNPDRRLLPYLTANVRFVIEQNEDAMAVPNAALRWAPTGGPTEAAAPSSMRASGGNSPSGEAGKPASGDAAKSPDGARPGGTDTARQRPARANGPDGAPRADRSGQRGASRRGTVWVLSEGGPRPVEVKVGISDGLLTAVESGDLKDGDQVIVGEAVAGGPGASGTTNPFAPANPFGGRPGGGGGGRR